MKKLSFAMLAVMPFALCSCFDFNSAKGIQGKTFTYSSCTGEEVKSGTSESFYVSTNPAGATKDDVVKSLVHALYNHGTYGTYDEIYFTNHVYNGFSYKGTSLDVYAYNEYEYDEMNLTDECYYMALDSGFTSVHFVDDNTSDITTLGDYTFSLGMKYSSETRNSVSVQVLYKTTAADTSIKYDATNKKVTMSMDVTYSETVNDANTTSVISYTLEFAQK